MPDYDEAIRRTAERHGLDPRLVKAIVAAESNFQSNAYRWEPKRGDASYGLMQVLFATAKTVGYSGEPEGLYDPDTNLEIGARYLAKQLARYRGDVPSAVAAYNAGTARRTKSGKFSNQGYVDRVLRFYNGGGGAPPPQVVPLPPTPEYVRYPIPVAMPGPQPIPVRVQAGRGGDGSLSASIEAVLGPETMPLLIAVGAAFGLMVLFPSSEEKRRRG